VSIFAGGSLRNEIIPVGEGLRVLVAGKAASSTYSSRLEAKRKELIGDRLGGWIARDGVGLVL